MSWQCCFTLYAITVARHLLQTYRMVSPPTYDELDYISAPERLMDMLTFLTECPVPTRSVPSHQKKQKPPHYTCTVSCSGYASRKMENSFDKGGKVCTPSRRNWQDVFVVIQGTKLELYKSRAHTHKGISKLKRSNSMQDSSPQTCSRSDSLRESMPLNRPRSASAPLVTSCIEQSTLLKEYSLLEAVVGIASDYTKKDNILRIRVEDDQFLLQCTGSSDLINWLEAIQKGANIAEPLDSRSEPRFICGPRRHRGRKIKTLAYEVFEASAPDAPLRQKSHVSRAGLFNLTGTQPLARCMNFNDADRLLIMDMISNARTEALSQNSHGTRTEKRGPRAWLQKNERFVCPILTATHPRAPRQATAS